MKKVAVLGAGRLGICTALTLEKAGYDVYCYDINPSIIQAINTRSIASHEPGVSTMLINAVNIHATSTLEDVIDIPILFCVVATPSLEDGSYNHKYVDTLVDEMIKRLPSHPGKKLFNICCTTMPGYCDTVQEKLRAFDIDVCYNPEFIAQGNILHDFTHPDMVLIGEANSESGDQLIEIYKNLVQTNPVYNRMTRTEAELTKISINCFITTKISFANTIGDMCITKGLRPDVVLKAVGSDSRIGNKYLRWGHGYGGPCFPRDNRALSFYFQTQHLQNRIGEATDTTNQTHTEFLCEKLFELHIQTKKPFLFRELAYKPKTAILEESANLALALCLQKRGVSITIQDTPAVVEQLQSKYLDLFLYASNPVDERNYLVVDASLRILQ
jgi:UDPglucose 6-dehydrogenase